MIGPVAACTKCSRLIFSREGWLCEAYPKAGTINPKIKAGGNPHTTPVEGDHGVQFEPKEK